MVVNIHLQQHNMVMHDLDVERVSQLAVVAILCLVVLVCFIKLIFVGSIYKKAEQDRFESVQHELLRLVGGCVVFLIAIVANSPWIYFISLLIGGLLIASEQFMIFLAGVVSSDKAKVSTILENYSKISKMTNEEIESKLQKEVNEELIINSLPSGDSLHLEVSDSVNVRDEAAPHKNEPVSLKEKEFDFAKIEKETRERLIYAEQYVLKLVENRIPWTYSARTNIKITNSTGNRHTHDIAVLDDKQKLYATIEVKTLGGMHSKMVKRIVERESIIESADDTIKRLYVFIFREFNFDQLTALKEYRTKLKSHNVNVGIAYYEFKDDSKAKFSISAIDAEDMDMLRDDRVELPF